MARRDSTASRIARDAGRGTSSPDRMPEDPSERLQWDKMVTHLARGDRLKMIGHQLKIMAQVTPQPKLRMLYAVMANDVADLIAERDEKDKEPTWQR